MNNVARFIQVEQVRDTYVVGKSVTVFSSRDQLSNLVQSRIGQKTSERSSLAVLNDAFLTRLF